MKGRQIKYTTDELTWIEARQTEVRRDLLAAFCAEFGRSDISLDNFKALLTRKGYKTGRSGRFPKGTPPPNKGKKMPYNANSAKTQFKKGVRGGVAIKLYKPIGTERVTCDGYVERKINDDMPLRLRWKAVHRINWEAEHGPVPKGMRLKCLSDDKANTAASNWQAIPYALGPRLNGRFGRGYDSAPAEVRPAIMAAALLEHKIRDIRKDGKAKHNGHP